MREFLLILADVYVRGEPQPLPALPQLDAIARFGHSRPLPRGWRAWLAGYAGRSELADAPVAAVAATLIERREDGAAHPQPLWMATPVQLRAALTHVRLEGAGVLRLSDAEARTLANDFNALWGPSGLTLYALGGQFLLEGLAVADALTFDPALALGADIAPFLPQAPALRALGAELELWLHDHAVNRERLRSGRAPATALWLWGGGVGPVTRRARALPVAFADDLFVRGLWRAGGAEAVPLAARLPPLETLGDRALAVLELFGATSAAGGLGDLEERWLAPLLGALGAGRLGRLQLIANERLFSLARAARLKFWRRPRSMLAARA